MKTRFTTLDIISILDELQQVVGMRVNQVYDVDHKTYLIKLQKPEKKSVLLIESGSRLHTTEFEWPKNPAPSGFSMKLRKHIKNKRLEHMKQLGVDRVVDLQFGSGEAAYHLILEMYDRGNLVLTDHEFKILNILRPRVAGEDKFLVRETYPVELAKSSYDSLDQDRLKQVLDSAKEKDTLKKVLMPHFEYGPSLLEHVLLANGLAPNTVIKTSFDFSTDLNKLVTAMGMASEFAAKGDRKGFVIMKEETRPSVDGKDEVFHTYQEFHPFLFKQFCEKPFKDFDNFNSACDQFYSELEAQKLDLKAVQQEKAVVKKLENVKKDHETRIEKLQELQYLDRRKGEYIEMNSDLVDNAIRVIVSAIANQIPWEKIKEMIKEATENGDPTASRIKQLKLEMNHIAMLLSDPYAHLDDSDDDEAVVGDLLVDVDLDLTAQANARKYFDQKKQAATKERKTVESGSVAMKSAEKKTKQALKEMAAISSINKARKVFWFEKFFWFISSENYLVIGGRDAQQNEMIVKRYMKPNDVYVHADLHGAATVVVKNSSALPVPPKTLTEAGQFAVCFSAAWDSKVITSAYWVYPDQVSKTAPTGEYLTVGSFMIRGKKNFMPPSDLIMGFGFMFKLEESSVERHAGERKVKTGVEGSETVSVVDDLESVADSVQDLEIEIEEGESSSDEEATENTRGALERLESVKEEEEGEVEAVTQVTKNQEEEEEVEELTKVIEKEKVVDLGDDNESCDRDGDTASENEEIKEETITAKEVKTEDVEFPDTDVKIEFGRSGSVEIKTRTASMSDEIEITQPMQSRKKKIVKAKPNQKKVEPKEEVDEKNNKNDQGKRGKKGKMKKIKEKYKDQDEEEKRLRMQLLQSDGREKEVEKNKKKNKKGKGGTQPQQNTGPREKKPPPKPKQELQGDNEDEDEEKVAAVNDETDMLDSLTGIPVLEDELLFAVPVVAPYSTFSNFKYKVKLIPGTGKRGKACKTAIAMFLADKNTNQREKDLLKSVKDQDPARNLPGKVKLSAPHLQKIKSKKKSK